jgi:spermidine synthase
MRRLAAHVAFFFSGFAALTFEIVWFRHLGLALGATTLAMATTTAAYMGGLTLGSALGSKRADLASRPFRSYGWLEIIVALCGLAMPLLCAQVSRADAHLLGDAQGELVRAFVRFAFAGGLLLIPTTAMGLTLPVLARAVVRSDAEAGPEVGLLYTVNIAGAVVGAALAGFVLIPRLGLLGTNWVAVVTDLGLGAAALAIGAREHAARSAAPAEASATPPLSLAVLVVIGAAAMALQVLWTRALGTVLGPSTYALSAIVCAYLLGLAFGGGLGSRAARSSANVRQTLATVLLVTAFGSWLGIAVVDDLPGLVRSLVGRSELSFGTLVGGQVAIALVSLLPATIGMGAIFPLALAAWASPRVPIGSLVGRAYAMNTAGNIIGVVIAVFLLLPVVGVEWGLRLSALSYLVVALGLRARGRRRFVGAAMLALFLLLLGSPWDVAQWTAGLYRSQRARALSAAVGRTTILFHADGLGSTVTVEHTSGVRALKVDGKIDASDGSDMPTQVLVGLLPMLVRPDARDVAVIGCGSGVTVGSALAAGASSVTLVELEGQVLVAAQRFFSDVNHDAFLDPRLSIVHDDGRNFLRRTEKAFDVIASEPSNPWIAGAASLFTREFFQAAKDRLKPHGAFSQWLQHYELASSGVDSILKTFHSVFPHVLVFSLEGTQDLVVLGALEPLRLERAPLTATVARAKAELARAMVHTVDDVLALALLDEDELSDTDAPLNTDDNAFVEYSAPLDMVFDRSARRSGTLARTNGRRAELIAKLGGLGDAPADARLALAKGYLRAGLPTEAKHAVAPLLGTADVVPRAAAVAEILSQITDSPSPPRR